MKIFETEGFSLPRWKELSDLGLYLDQVQIVLDAALRPITPGPNGNITGTMITNYVKQKVVPQTEKKKYYRRHLAQLITVFLLKHVLSTAEIVLVLNELGMGTEQGNAYDLFCTELENRLCIGNYGTAGADASGCPPLTSAAIDALAGKLRFEIISHRRQQGA